MSSYVPAALRRLVTARAQGLCEYCLIHQMDTHFGCEIEHIIAEKHGGESTDENLAWACAFCNRRKGADVGTFSSESKTFCRLFNPRIDKWRDHFELVGERIVGITEIGRTTAILLQLNHSDRILEREVLARYGKYPSTAAKRILENK